MWKNKLNFKEASEYVMNKRKVIDLNDEFIEQLKTFERILKQAGSSFDFGM